MNNDQAPATGGSQQPPEAADRDGSRTPAPSSISTTTHSDSRRRRYFSSKDRWSAILALALVIVGLFQLVVLWRQADLMSTQDNISKAQEDDNRAVQRAFVNVEDLTVVPVTENVGNRAEKLWRFTSTISNDGNTPTVDLRYIAAAREFFANGQSQAPNVFEQGIAQVHMIAVTSNAPAHWLQLPSDPAKLMQAHKYRIYSFVGAHGTRQVSWIEIPQDAFRWSVDHGWRTYFYGEAVYEDVFSPKTSHVSKFCFLLTGEDQGGGFRARAALCDYWNCADSECKDSKVRYERDVAAHNAKYGSEPPIPGFMISRP